MKLVFLISPVLLILASCAPKATIVEQDPTPKPKEESKATEPTDLKLPPKDNLGLLDPPRLTNMPTQKDMKPTIPASGGGSSTVIATPGEKKATSE